LGVTKEEALNRLRTIEGHIRGVARMVEEQAYCIDILHQTIAIQRAIDKLNQDVLEGHLQTCVTKAVQGQNDQDRERVIRELLDVFAASGKR
jgi:DNA-binding FrmR family transcriptional regulator